MYEMQGALTESYRNVRRTIEKERDNGLKMMWNILDSKQLWRSSEVLHSYQGTHVLRKNRNESKKTHKFIRVRTKNFLSYTSYPSSIRTRNTIICATQAHPSHSAHFNSIRFTHFTTNTYTHTPNKTLTPYNICCGYAALTGAASSINFYSKNFVLFSAVHSITRE